MKKIILIILIYILAFSFAKAQDKEQIPYALTLEESILIAKNKSFTMRDLRANLKIAEYNLKIATSRLKTQVGMNFSLPDYSETVKSIEDSTGVIFFPARQLKYAGGLTIRQPLPTDGSIFITSGLQSIDDFRRDLVTSTLNARIGFSQPLDIIYNYSSIRKTLKDAELNYEYTSKSLKRSELELVTRVSRAYYNLLSIQREVEIAFLDLERQKEAYNISQKKYEAGLIREVDALQMEVELAQSQDSYDGALLNQGSALSAFKLLIGIGLHENVVLKTDMTYKSIFVDMDDAVERALKNSLELREQDINIEMQKMNIKEQKVQGRIRGSINAYVEKYEVSNIADGNSLLSSIEGAYNNFIDFSGLHRPKYGASLDISVPILDGGRNKSQVKAAEVRLERNIMSKEERKRSIETEVRNLVATLNTNLKRVQLLEKNTIVAEKSFEITQQRFSDGDIDSQAFALERNRLNTAYRNQLNAFIRYRLSIAELMEKTFYDYENDRAIE